jgi:molybdopterin synthase sulfur carrier subunit
MSARSEITLRYFAWVREKTGPSGVVTVADLLAWLQSRGPGFEDAFSKPGVIRTAIDKRHVKAETPIAGAQEIAFFPPVTGG